jgi:hypothetical protein
MWTSTAKKQFNVIKTDKQQSNSFCKLQTQIAKKIAIENPVGIMSSEYRKPDQIVHPYFFAKDDSDTENIAEKKTCFWLKGLEPLQYQIKAQPPERIKFDSGKTMPQWYADAWRLPKDERAKLRSKTFPGIAKAIAEQWAGQV